MVGLPVDKPLPRGVPSWIRVLVVVLLSVMVAFFTKPLRSEDTVSPTENDSTIPRLFSALNDLVVADELRYFSATLDSECPFWAAQLLCTSATSPCLVCECDPNEIPHQLRSSLLNHSAVSPHDLGCGPGAQDAVTASSISNGNLIVADLLRNPEANTEYVGELANRVWENIYLENCNIDIRDRAGPISDQDFKRFYAASSSRPKSCEELQTLYRAISGLHASISTHIAVKYVPVNCSSARDPTIRDFRKFTPSVTELERRVLNHPDRKENLRFLFGLVMRAVELYVRDVGIATASNNTSFSPDTLHKMGLMRDLISVATISDGFDERVLSLVETEWASLQPAVKRIMEYMDCLSCEKCRLWGKLQITGLDTALRILAGSHQPVDVLSAATTARYESRNGIALINLLRQLALSMCAVFHPAALDSW